MGQFRVELTLLAEPNGPSRTLAALVDTGAAYTMAPYLVLESLGCQPVRTQRVVLADGRIEEWSMTEIVVECEGRRATTPILMGPANAPVLLGSTTLQELGLGIDTVNHRLIPVEFYQASNLTAWERSGGAVLSGSGGCRG